MDKCDGMSENEIDNKANDLSKKIKELKQSSPEYEDLIRMQNYYNQFRRAGEIKNDYNKKINFSGRFEF